jgi:hypothetical protein
MSASIGTIRFAIGAFLALAWQAAIAYETPVHSEITRSAFNRAVADRDFLKDLGILHLFDPVTMNVLSEPFLGNGVLGWAMSGSMTEDDFIRSLYHFYDPLAPANSQGLLGTFDAAPDWAFDTSRNPTYSLPGTRQSLYGALTNTDTIVRPKLWRDTFRGLGQFTHLLQDMAQPQHVRNDDHFSLTEQAYGLFPDYSRYEKHTLFLLGLGALTFGGYPTVSLPTYRGYWNNGSGSGLAQSTNLNFVSEGTNLDSGKYGSPLGTLLKEEVIAQVLNVRNQPIAGATNVTIQYVTYSYTDPYRSALVTNDRLSTFSLFDLQRMKSVGKHAYSLYNTNHRTYAAILIPQAVGYSAGLIGRFFRGSLDISPPDEMIYGIVDHSKISQTDPLNGFVGFDTIKLKVRNASAGAEAMTGGKLVAVAKFHRNGCYTDSLSGEFTAAGAPCPNFRTDTEEIVVSNEFNNVNLDKTTPKPFTFTFARPIPINATDLYIQVVYRGALGADPDEIAVGTKDVFEPTYIAIFNSTDHILFNGVFVDTTSKTLLPTLGAKGAIEPQYDRTNLRVLFGFTNGFTFAPLATIDALPPARYGRVALITDRSPFPSPTQAIGFAFNAGAIFQYGAETNQYDIQTSIYYFSQFSSLRGIPVWNSLTFFRSYPTLQAGDLSTLPALANMAPFPLTTLTFKP